LAGIRSGVLPAQGGFLFPGNVPGSRVIFSVRRPGTSHGSSPAHRTGDKEHIFILTDWQINSKSPMSYTATLAGCINSKPSYTRSMPSYINSAPSYINSVASYIRSAPSYIDSVLSYISSEPSYTRSMASYINSVASYINSVASYIDSVVSYIDSVVSYIRSLLSYIDSERSYIRSLASCTGSMPSYIDSVLSFSRSLASYIDSMASYIGFRAFYIELSLYSPDAKGSPGSIRGGESRSYLWDSGVSGFPRSRIPEASGGSLLPGQHKPSSIHSKEVSHDQ